MKLVVAIVQDQDAGSLIVDLTDKEFRVTKLASTGGFLKAGNTTLLIGADDGDIESVVEMIKHECKSVKVKEGDQEITVSGANLFIMDIDQYLKI